MLCEMQTDIVLKTRKQSLSSVFHLKIERSLMSS